MKKMFMCNYLMFYGRIKKLNFVSCLILLFLTMGYENAFSNNASKDSKMMADNQKSQIQQTFNNTEEVIESFEINMQNTVVVKGQVVAVDNSPIPGVTIAVKDKTIGTITDGEGRFELNNVPIGSTLVFSFIGMQSQEISISGPNSNLLIVLKEEYFGVDEVVVIGYGQVKKEDITGSVVAIGEDDFNQGSTSSPQDMIAGKVAGVNIVTDGGQPGSSVKVRIRGGSSMSASNDPLIVVDGVPLDDRGIDGMSNILSTINPDDIESFTILKDASSTAIYGSRASNGVIIIKTKSAKKGQALSLSFNSKFSIGKVVDMVDMLSASEFSDIINSRYTGDSNLAIRERLGEADTDWQKEIYQTSFGHDHNFSVAGSYKNVPIRASVGYTDQEGALLTSNMKRTTGTLNINPTFWDDHLRLRVGVKGMKIENRFADTGAIGAALHFDPTQPVKSDAQEFDKYGGYYTWLLNGERNINGTINPVAMLEQRSDKSSVDRVIGDFQLDYTFHGIPELRMNMVAGIDYANSDGKFVNDDNAAFAEADNSTLKRTYTDDLKNELFDFYMNYDKKFNDQHTFSAMLGYEWQHMWSKTETETKLRNVEDLTNVEDETENYLVSFFSRINYSFRDKYLLTATLRQDGSSRFHEDNRWGTFPSLALAWKMKNERFLKDSETLSSFTLRLGYGITGQQSLTDNDYPYMGTYTWSNEFSSYQFGSEYVSTLRPNGYDENLKWEETTTYNAAIDYGFLNNRIYGSFDFYYKKTKDLINTIPVPSGTNFTDLLTTNVGNLENKGVEFSINSLVVSTPDFSWDLGFNLTFNKNEITKLTNYDDPNYSGVETGQINGVGVGNYIQVHAVGHSLNSFFVYEQEYDNNGMPIEGSYVDRNNDGTVDASDKYYAGNPDPDVFMGISSKFNYKNLDLSFNGRASFGNYVYNNTAVLANYQLMVVNDYLTNMPASIKETEFENPQQYSDYYVEDASFFRMDNITLGYKFNSLKLFQGNLNLRLYSSVQNVFVISDYKGLDPEVSDGIEYNVFPRPRTFIFGIQANF